MCDTSQQIKLGDVVQLFKERSIDPEADGYERFIGLEHIDPGELRVRRWGDIADGVTFTNVFRPGQVLFGKRRAYQRKVAVADFSGVCSGDIYVLEADRSAFVEVTTEAANDQAALSAHESDAAPLELVLPGGVVARVCPGFDAALLRRIVEALS